MNDSTRETIDASAGPPTSQARRIASTLDDARNRDAFGHQIHTVLAILYLYLLPLSTAPKEWAFGLLLIWACVRLVPHTWRCFHQSILDLPVMWSLGAWAGWQALSLLWSDNLAQGFDDLAAFRVLITPLLLWPILDRAPWLIAATLLGVFTQNITQGLQELGWVELSNVRSDRMRGLLHPVHTATWCAVAMVWHLSAVLLARGWLRWVSFGLMVIAGWGLLITGSRGPWLAAAVVIPLTIIVIAIRRPSTRRMALALVVVGIAIGFAAWPLAHERVHSRIHDAVEEYRKAVNDGIYWTSTGLRLAQLKWSWTMFTEHPIHGIGAGDFASSLLNDPDFQAALKRAPSQRKQNYIIRDHPHSTYLHTLASQGAIGGIILAVVLFLALFQCWRDRPDHPYVHGSFCALVIWIIGAQFDCYHLNGTMLGMLGLIIAVTLPMRPAPRYALRARHESEQQEAVGT